MLSFKAKQNLNNQKLTFIQNRFIVGFVISAILLLQVGLANGSDVSKLSDCQEQDEIIFRGGSARLENDLFAGTDQNYTSGVAFTMVSHDISGKLKPECLPLPLRLHAEMISWGNPGFWAGADNPENTQNVVLKFGQAMYTPEDFSRTDLITDDRPYAGLLYVGMSWNRRKHQPAAGLETLETDEITLGIIGPSSLAEQSQNVVHDAIGSKRFLGWDNQLADELAVQLSYEQKYKKYRGAMALTPGYSSDLIHRWGLNLGNIETSVSVGVQGRSGWNLPNDFGSYTIKPGAENRSPSAVSHNNHTSSDESSFRPGIHLLGTIEAKYVAYDFSLDGNLFRDSHSVTRKPWLAEAAVGFAFNALIEDVGIKLAVMRVYRTREFEEQKDSQVYGSVALSLEF